MKEEEFQRQVVEKMEEISRKMTALSAIMTQVEGQLSTLVSIMSEGHISEKVVLEQPQKLKDEPSLNDQLKRIDAFLISIGEKMDMRIRQEK